MSITTPVSAATPASAMKPTATATERLNPSHHISQKPPTIANGTESMTISVSVTATCTRVTICRSSSTTCNQARCQPPSAAREKMHMSHTTIPRRTVFLGATAVGLGAAAGFRIPTGEARAPIVIGQVPCFYRFMVGKFQATVVSDGPLPLGEPSATLKGPTKEELAKALANNFL